MLVLFVLGVMTSTTAQAAYSINKSSTTTGGGTWGRVLKLSARLSGTKITFTVSKKDGGRFSSSGMIYLKVGTYRSYGADRATGRVYAYRTKASSFTHDLNGYSGYPKLFYARYESDKGGYAWVGPIKVSQITQTPPHVTSVRPSTATLNQQTTFTIRGSNLTSGMGFWIDQCEDVREIAGGSSSQRRFSCMPSHSAGRKSGEVKDRPNGRRLLSFSVNVEAPAPSVTSVRPSTATLNQQTTFTIRGSNLTSGMGFWIDQCEGVREISGGSSSRRQFSCTPSHSTGRKSGKIKDRPEGTKLFGFEVLVEPEPKNDPNNLNPADRLEGMDPAGVEFSWGFNNDPTTIEQVRFTLVKTDRYGGDAVVGGDLCRDKDIGIRTRYSSTSCGTLEYGQWYKWWVELRFKDKAHPTGSGGYFRTEEFKYKNVDKWAQDAALYMVAHGIVDEPADRNLKGTDPISRAGLATMIYRAMGGGAGAADTTFRAWAGGLPDTPFTDVTDTNLWYFRQAVYLGALTYDDDEAVFGGDRFNAADHITRAWVVKALLEAWDIAPLTSFQGVTPFQDLPFNHEAAGYVYKARQLGVISGDAAGNFFYPNNQARRQDLFKMLHQILDAKANPAGRVPRLPDITQADFAKPVVADILLDKTKVSPEDTLRIQWTGRREARYAFLLYDATLDRPVDTSAFLSPACRAAKSDGADGCLGQENPSKVTSVNWKIPSALPAGDYRVKVAVWSDRNQSAGGLSRPFTVQPALPEVSNVRVSPQDLRLGAPLAVQWTSANQAGYRLFLYEGDTENPVNTSGFLDSGCTSAGFDGSEGCLTAVFSSTDQTASWVLPQDLRPGRYRIAVVADNSAGDSAPAFSDAFTVARFGDVSPWAQAAADFVVEQGIVEVKGEGLLRGTTPVNRAELATMVYRALGGGKSDAGRNFQQWAAGEPPSPYSDIREAVAWYYKPAVYMGTLVYEQDPLSRSPFDPGNFDPAGGISRAWALKVLLEAWNIPPAQGPFADPFADVPPDHEAAPYIYAARNLGIIEGDQDRHTFGPNDPAHREDVFVMLYRIMDTDANLRKDPPAKPVITREDFKWYRDCRHLGVRYEQPVRHGVIPPSVAIETLRGLSQESRVDSPLRGRYTVELQAKIRGGENPGGNFIAWEVDGGCFEDLDPGSNPRYRKVRWIAPERFVAPGAESRYQLRVYVGDNLGSEVSDMREIVLNNDNTTSIPGTGPVISLAPLPGRLNGGSHVYLHGTASDSGDPDTDADYGIRGVTLEYRLQGETDWRTIATDVPVDISGAWRTGWNLPDVAGPVTLRATTRNLRGYSAEASRTATIDPRLVIEGYVEDSYGKPIANARVRLKGLGAQFTESDDGGWFSFSGGEFDVQAGISYKVQAYVENHASQEETLRLDASNPRQSLVLAIDREPPKVEVSVSKDPAFAGKPVEISAHVKNEPANLIAMQLILPDGSTEEIKNAEDAGNSSWTAKYYLPEGVEGSATLRVIVEDLSGNQGKADISFDIRLWRPGRLEFENHFNFVAENAGSTSLKVVRTEGTDGDVQVHYSVKGSEATNGVDYLLTDGVLEFASGEDSKEIPVEILDDSDYEEGEFIRVELGLVTGGATLGDNKVAILNIEDDDPRHPGDFRFEVAAKRMNEGDGSVILSLVREGGADGSVEITLSQSGGTAEQGRDFTFDQGTLRFADGEVSKRLEFPIQDDGEYEGDETFTLSLMAATDGAGIIAPADVTITIEDNDSRTPGTFQFEQPRYEVNEGDGTLFMDIVRSDGLDGRVTLTLDLSGKAKDPDDLRPAEKEIVFADGEQRRTVVVEIIDDDRFEGPESARFRLTTTNPDARIGPWGTTVVRIADNDSAQAGTLRFAQAAYQGAEADGVVEIEVVRTGGDQGEIGVEIGIDGGSAVEGDDYHLGTPWLTFADGVQSQLLTLELVDDGQAEGPEDVVLRLTAVTSGDARIGTPETAVVTIQDADVNAQPVVDLVADQAGRDTRVVVTHLGPVEVRAEITDANAGDGHRIDWSGSSPALLQAAESMDEEGFRFDPSFLPSGFYKLRVSVEDDGVPPLTATGELLLKVVEEEPLLGEADSDGDGLTDREEGFGDQDRDFLSDQHDHRDQPLEELPLIADTTGSYSIQAEPGIALRLGEVAFASGGERVAVTSEDIARLGGDEGGAPLAGAGDEGMESAGYVDLVARGLSAPGQSIRLVTPLTVPLADAASYRLFSAESGWRDFVSDANNLIDSTVGEPGICPPPGDAVYTPGLVAGARCIRLTVEDGGPNDLDGSANQSVRILGGPAWTIPDQGTAELSVSTSRLRYNRRTRRFQGTVTLTNEGGTTVQGPVHILFADLVPGVVLTNADGQVSGTPYITLPVTGGLAPGASARATIEFSNRTRNRIGFTTSVHVGAW